MTHATIAGPDNYVLIDNGPQQVANAWDFLNWFCSPEVHLEYCIATGHLPIRKSETELPAYQTYLEKYPADEVFVANLENVTKATAEHPDLPEDLSGARAGRAGGAARPGAAAAGAARRASQQIDSILAAGQ